MNGVYKYLLEFADRMGIVESMLCYDSELMVVKGKTRSGEKEWEITLHLKEVKGDGN